MRQERCEISPKVQGLGTLTGRGCAEPPPWKPLHDSVEDAVEVKWSSVVQAPESERARRMEACSAGTEGILEAARACHQR